MTIDLLVFFNFLPIDVIQTDVNHVFNGSGGIESNVGSNDDVRHGRQRLVVSRQLVYGNVLPEKFSFVS